MDNARQILSTLGVNQDRILQESFGESKRSTATGRLEVRPVETVVFMDSGKVCQASAGSTLLDLAGTTYRYRTVAARAYAVRVLREF